MELIDIKDLLTIENVNHGEGEFLRGVIETLVNHINELIIQQRNHIEGTLNDVHHGDINIIPET